jgi:hypothetical protein
MDYGDQGVCGTCHNPHKTATINREWAQSAHGDRNPINQSSEDPPTGYFSGAWSHYNWSCDGTSGLACGPTDTATTSTSAKASSKRACQRCHTTSGFIAYADALRSENLQYVADINSGLVSLVTYTINYKPEMLKCSGCHTDNKGTLRDPGQITANYDYVYQGKTYAKVSHTYANVAGSNVCMTCHVGRESGATVKGLNDPALISSGTISTFSYTNMGFINPHYLTAGGQVFTATGYEFPGRPYNNISEYLHDKIGTAATTQMWPFVETGSNGPCAGCHMSRPNKNGDHLFLPVSRSTTSIGEVTGITSVVCQKCHGVSNTPVLELVKMKKPQYVGALEVVKELLQSKLNYYFAPASPYFFSAAYDPAYLEITAGSHCSENLPIKNWQTGGTSSFAWNAAKLTCDSIAGITGTAGTGQNNLGAAFNFQLLEHDPGGYAHNSMYARRLIYDSIDWVDNGAMDYSVAATVYALPDSTQKTEAIEYLLQNGPHGNEAERP